jgi:response regulator NasT
MTSTPPSKLRIAVADDERDTRQFFAELLPHLGHTVVAVAETGRQLVDQCRATSPDLVIADIKMPEMDGIEAAAAINRERQTPVVLLSAHHDAELLERASAEHIMTYLVKPVKPADLQASILLATTRFALYQKARKEAADLRQALEDRKLLERAKGVVVRRLRIDEADALRKLQKLSSDHNRKLIQVAAQVLDAEEVFRALEECGTGR